MKLPQVVAQAGTSASYPQPEASLAPTGSARALMHAGGTLTQTGADFNEIYAKAQKELREADANAQYDQAVSNIKQKFADYDISLKTQGVDPDKYPEQVGRGLYDMATEETAQLKYPEAKAKFQRALQQFSTEKINTAKYDALKMKQGQVELTWSILQPQDARTAVNGAKTEDRQDALARGLARPQEGLRRGIYSPEQAAAKTKEFLTQVQHGQIQRDIRNPELRAGVISTLLNGGYELPYDEQIKLAETLQKHSDQEYKDTREAIDKWFIEQKAMKVSDLFAQASAKTLTVPALELAREEWRLSRTDYAAIQHELTKPADEPTSDPAVLLRIDGDVHSQFPRITERQLDGLRQSGQLNRKDYLAAKDRLRETREGLLNRGESLQMRRHTQAEQEGMADLGIPTLFDKLEPAKEKARAAFLTELRTRSNAYGGQEDALTIKDAIIPRFKKLLDQDAQLTIEQTRKLIDAQYSTPEALEQARRTNQITKGQYDAQKRIWLDLDTASEIQKANERAAAERKATQGKGGAARPTDRK